MIYTPPTQIVAARPFSVASHAFTSEPWSASIAPELATRALNGLFTEATVAGEASLCTELLEA